MSTLVTISDGTLSASVDSLGAQLMSVRLDDAEYLWQGDPTWWPRRAPILFPIVGVLRDGCAQSASGPIKLARHGIARLYEHRIVEKSPERVTFELSDSEETWPAYPYHFALNMTYAVEDGVLTQRYQVRNTGSVDLPFVLGGHPAFKVPVPKNNGSELPDYELAFTRAWTSLGPSITPDGLCDFEHPQRLITDSDSLPLSWELFDRELTLTLQDVPDRRVALLPREISRGTHGVELTFEGFDYLGVWCAGSGCPFVAIEPWTGVATALDEDDVFEHKRNMTLLSPGETFSRAFTIRPF